MFLSELKYIIFITALMFQLNFFSTAKYDTIDVAQFDSLRKENYVILDVRTPLEYEQGHIEDAILIDFRSADFEEQLSKLDKDARYLVYCRSGNRSAKTCVRMNEMGFKTAINLGGGIIAWEREGKPVLR